MLKNARSNNSQEKKTQRCKMFECIINSLLICYQYMICHEWENNLNLGPNTMLGRELPLY